MAERKQTVKQAVTKAQRRVAAKVGERDAQLASRLAALEARVAELERTVVLRSSLPDTAIRQADAELQEADA